MPFNWRWSAFNERRMIISESALVCTMYSVPFSVSPVHSVCRLVSQARNGFPRRLNLTSGIAASWPNHRQTAISRQLLIEKVTLIGAFVIKVRSVL